MLDVRPQLSKYTPLSTINALRYIDATRSWQERVMWTKNKRRIVKIPNNRRLLRRSAQALARLFPSSGTNNYGVAFSDGGVRENALLHKDNTFFYMFDIKSFYPSFSRLSTTEVENMFEQGEANSHVRERVVKLFERDRKRLLTGCPTSPIVSSIIFTSRHQRLRAVAAKYGLTFSRYIDDLTFSGQAKLSEEESLDLMVEVGQAIRPFTLNERKTQYLERGVDKVVITGIDIRYAECSLNKAELKKKFRPNFFFSIQKLVETEETEAAALAVLRARLKGYKWDLLSKRDQRRTQYAAGYLSYMLMVNPQQYAATLDWGARKLSHLWRLKYEEVAS